jgi:hypothetical protein
MSMNNGDTSQQQQLPNCTKSNYIKFIDTFLKQIVFKLPNQSSQCLQATTTTNSVSSISSVASSFSMNRMMYKQSTPIVLLQSK